ncbi:glutaredoxin family protein [Nesterenkonia haasae]|uniref:glutaredoxin family protein n=1 Tax=Nesterenkonia haasae TaxID=2587813 RepID=UPI00139130B3|nr:glutaredoxin family protein [Nesterenkonia haasae]NDK31667.1 glutaredoxin family protein [Nesterenkonia haasae]
MSESPEVVVDLLTTPGCHLCTEALRVSAEVCAEFGITVQETNIEHDGALRAQFAEEIPVLRINGRVRDFWKIDPGRLRRLLAEATGAAAGE